jgi:hypothetical protein
MNRPAEKRTVLRFVWLDEDYSASKIKLVRQRWAEIQGRHSGWRSRQAKIVGCGSGLNFNPSNIPFYQVVASRRPHYVRFGG